MKGYILMEFDFAWNHYNDVIIGTMASQISVINIDLKMKGTALAVRDLVA